MRDRSDVVGLDACLARVVDRERVAAVQEAMPPAEDVEQAADVFALLEGGEMCVCDLAAAGMSESAPVMRCGGCALTGSSHRPGGRAG